MLRQVSTQRTGRRVPGTTWDDMGRMLLAASHPGLNADGILTQVGSERSAPRRSMAYAGYRHSPKLGLRRGRTAVVWTESVRVGSNSPLERSPHQMSAVAAADGAEGRSIVCGLLYLRHLLTGIPEYVTFLISRQPPGAAENSSDPRCLQASPKSAGSKPCLLLDVASDRRGIYREYVAARRS